jgi:hypothetical protein
MVVLLVVTITVSVSFAVRTGTVEAFQQQQYSSQYQHQAPLLSRPSDHRRTATSWWLSTSTTLSLSTEEPSSFVSTSSSSVNGADSKDPNPPPFSDTKASEKALRNEIATRNSIVDNEGQYTIRDGAGVSDPVLPSTASVGLNKEEQQQQKIDSSSTNQQQQRDETDESFERILRQRPYPLFLLEKGVEIVEDTVVGLLEKFDNTVSADDMSIRSEAQRERVVVLGTGWGAAAFVKGIDTSQYDVTVISPRNYFLFTPMLAGASVGTVDYRSITQPIREVRS